MQNTISLYFLWEIKVISKVAGQLAPKKRQHMLKSMVYYLYYLCTIIGIGFIETSALDSSNVEKAFINVINDIYKSTVYEN